MKQNLFFKEIYMGCNFFFEEIISTYSYAKIIEENFMKIEF